MTHTSYGIAGTTNVTEIGAADVPSGRWVLGDGAEKELRGQRPEKAMGTAFYRIRVKTRPLDQGQNRIGM